MLGKYVKVRVTKPLGAFDSETNIRFQLNYGNVESGLDPHTPVKGAYIMGVNHPVHNFEGRVIAVIKDEINEAVFIVVSPKSKRFIIHDIRTAIDFVHKEGTYTVDCLYERSCGAIVFREINGENRFLLIKNKRSAHWGFPKGHIEVGETEEDTAKREVLEETGLHIDILPSFRHKSEYSIQNRIEKTVLIFLAKTADTKTIIQPEEIEDYIWLNYESALKTLNYDNDKMILIKAQGYMAQNKI
ncbi:MAG: NUDIX domain-containing protein [Oscillospiraceae bacterium]